VSICFFLPTFKYQERKRISKNITQAKREVRSQ
jgi:hypothetical protein